MNLRRYFTCLASTLFFATAVHAAAPGSDETTSALKEALTRGAAAAVDGLGNGRVRIALPEKVKSAEKLLQTGSALLKNVFGGLLKSGAAQ